MALLAHAGSAADRAYSATNYSASITLDFDQHSLTAREIIRLRIADPSIQTIELDAAHELIIDTVGIGHRPLTFAQSADHLTITLPAKLARRELRLHFTFHGSPAKGLSFKDRQAYTVYNTSHWLVVDQSPANLATFRLNLNIPPGLTAVANGKTLKPNTEWNESRRIPDFVRGFAVARFHLATQQSGRTELRYLSEKFDPTQLAEIFRATPDILHFFETKSGVPYPSRTYTQAMVDASPEQELGDFTLLPDKYGQTLLDHPDELWLLAHELAHQWWGIGLSCREWSDFWLNEGIASCMADSFLGERYGEARYLHEIELAHQAYDQLKSAGKDHALCYRGKAENEVGGRLPYAKGAWVLHLLKQQIGEDAFWRGIALYTSQNWGRSVTSQDLQAAMQKAAHSDLSQFFAEWVY